MRFHNALLACFLLGANAALAVLPFNSTQFELRYTQWQKLHGQASQRTQPAMCSKDMRDSMPACKQKGQEWCWATGVAELARYYTGKGGCDNECEVVGWCPLNRATFDPNFGYKCSGQHLQCCPYSAHKQDCGADGAFPWMIKESADNFTGQLHRWYNGPMPQTILDQILAAGHPVLMLIGHNESRGSHVTAVGGCGGGEYFYHDPETDYYEQVAYKGLLDPHTFFNDSVKYVWLDTLYNDASIQPPTPRPGEGYCWKYSGTCGRCSSKSDCGGETCWIKPDPACGHQIGVESADNVVV